MTSLSQAPVSSSHRCYATSSTLSAVRLVCVAVLLLHGLSACAAQSTSVANASILSISGCNDVYPSTYNCSLPSVIRVQTAGLLPGAFLPGQSPRLILVGDGADFDLYTSIDSDNNSTLIATVRLQGYLSGLFSTELQVMLWDYRTRTYSPGFTGLSLAYLAPPVLTSVSGCQGSGTGTYGCEPTRDVLSFQGSGLLTLQAISYQLWVSSRSLPLQPGQGLQPVSDSVALLYLNQTVGVVLTVEQFNGTQQQLFFTMGAWSYLTSTWRWVQSASFDVSFIPLPAPLLTSAVGTGGGCTQAVGAANQSVSVNCYPQLSWLEVTGLYLYAGAVTVGSASLGYFPCPAQSSNNDDPTSGTYWLPLIPGLPANELLDVVFTSQYGQTSIPQVVAYSGAAVLTSVDPCANPGWNPINIKQCPAGAQLMVRGQNFVLDANLAVVISPYSATTPGGPVYCSNATLRSSNLITCTLPTLSGLLAAQLYGLRANIRLVFPASNTTTNSLTNVLLYALPNAPLVTAVSGCSSSSTAVIQMSQTVPVLQGCHSADVLSFQGSNLNGSRYALISPGLTGFNCQPLPGWSSTALQCQLPSFDADTFRYVPDTPYPFAWFSSSPWQTSNGIQLSFTLQPAPQPSTTSSQPESRDLAPVLAGVLGSVGFLVVVAASVYAFRAMRKPRPRSPREGSVNDEELQVRDGVSSDDYKGQEVELD